MLRADRPHPDADLLVVRRERAGQVARALQREAEAAVQAREAGVARREVLDQRQGRWSGCDERCADVALAQRNIHPPHTHTHTLAVDRVRRVLQIRQVLRIRRVRPVRRVPW